MLILVASQRRHSIFSKHGELRILLSFSNLDVVLKVWKCSKADSFSHRMNNVCFANYVLTTDDKIDRTTEVNSSKICEEQHLGNGVSVIIAMIGSHWSSNMLLRYVTFTKDCVSL